MSLTLRKTILRLCNLWVRSRSSQVTRSKASKCWFWLPDTVIHVFRSVFRQEREKWPQNIFFLIKIGGKWKIRKSLEYLEITWKVAVFGIQMAFKKSFSKISTSNVIQIFIDLVCIACIPVFLKMLEIFGYRTKFQNFEFKLTQFSKYSQIWKSEIAN